MSQDDVIDLMLGAAVIALGYALYVRHKKAEQEAKTPMAPPIVGTPAAPEIYQDADGNYMFDMSRLFEGVL